MTRLYADLVQVQRHDDVPTQFGWRGRHYVVQVIQAHWTESGQWWRAAAATALSSGETGSRATGGHPSPGLGGAKSARAAELVVAPIPASPKWAQRAWGELAPDAGAATGPASVDDGEREYWRVEATAGRPGGAGVYDLCFDWSAGSWTVARALD